MSAPLDAIMMIRARLKTVVEPKPCALRLLMIRRYGRHAWRTLFTARERWYLMLTGGSQRVV